MKIGILLSGSGVYDGSEIQEAVLAMLAIKEAGADYQCIALDKNQHHVINHLTGEEMNETRNMKVESARIARGDVANIQDMNPAVLDALVLPGGFGAAKNLSSWAFDGAAGTIAPEVKLLIVNMVNAGKPVCGLCVSPVLIAKALEGSAIHPTLTMGSSKGKSPYVIPDFHAGLKDTGALIAEKMIGEVFVDEKNKIVTAPCYMMDANILEIRNNIKKAIEATLALI
ncbi:isoprenoid biosynthesis protein ElbB [Putridiphycobacter roseus]|uniref:Isoprenoid biosynthesis protein ElbB n=1 Tax=Putridiphycobacter roseus TaxID=2219161 RepID=A0A2W1NIX2_9FLAO|nr:isoprenoid biosynthesis glyoxalase ElbB [Putridiphycobacter roseus]PZE17906.1 isoprenoid biosynthesis protein ElbB [Putridiphycobacter roseus]